MPRYSFTNIEKTDTILIYAECQKMSQWRQICTSISRDMPNVNIQSHPKNKIFKRFEIKLRNDWPVSKRIVLENPRVGQRAIAREIGGSQSSVYRMLKV